MMNNLITLDTYFDRIFYINLERDTDRNDYMIKQFQKFGITNFERINAERLTVLPNKEQYRNFIKNDIKYILGSLSCKASHLKCIKLCKERQYSKVLILEDDVIFLENPNKLLSQNLGMLENWDMLYFGGLIEQQFRSQIVCTHAYAIKNTVIEDIINMAIPSGMEIDNFYAKILQQMSYNYNRSGKYDIRIIMPFNLVIQNTALSSNIQN